MESEPRKTLKDVLGDNKNLKLCIERKSAMFIISALNELPIYVPNLNSTGRYLAMKNVLRFDLAFHKTFGCDDPECRIKNNIEVFNKAFAAEIAKDKDPLDLSV